MIESLSTCFLSEKRLGKSDANKVCSIAEDCFEQKMHSLDWCANYKIDQERTEINDLDYRVTFTCINNCKACFMCEFYS